MKPVRVLMALMAFFTLAHVFSAIAPNIELLMLSRFIAGLPHGAYFGVGAVVAARLAPKGRSAAAISVMFFGLTLANVVGVPLGTYMGHSFSWRLVMALICLVGIATVISLKIALPDLESQSTSSFREDLRIFRRSSTWFAIVITALGTGGFFAWLSYIAPLARDVAGVQEVSLLLIVAGLGMTVGNSFGGFLADKYSPGRAACALFACLATCLVLISATAGSAVALYILTFFTGVLAFSVVAPLQLLIMRATEGSEILGSSLGQACFNIGNSIGAYLGGLPLVFGLGYRYPSLVGSALACCGCLISLTMVIGQRERKLG